MTQEQIKLVKQTWEEILSGAKNRYDSILTTEDLKDLTVRQIQELIEYSKNFITTMDQLFCDYRHIIGMETLKVTDKSKLTSLLGEIELYRTDAKRIAGITDFNLVNLIPASSIYELKTVAGVKLTSKLRPGQIAAEYVEGSEQVENTTTSSVISMPAVFTSSNVIKYSADQVESAKAILLKAGLSTNGIRKVANGECKEIQDNGIHTVRLSDGYIQSAATTEDKRQKLLKVYKKECK